MQLGGGTAGTLSQFDGMKDIVLDGIKQRAEKMSLNLTWWPYLEDSEDNAGFGLDPHSGWRK